MAKNKQLQEGLTEEQAAEKIMEWMERATLEFWVTNYKDGEPVALALIDKKNLLRLWLYRLGRLNYSSPQEAKEQVKKLLKDKQSIHIANKECLVDVGEWAGKQGVGVFVYFPDDTYWQALKGVKNE